MKKILVLLSSYNGEKFISEQIDTILNQKYVDVHLLIRDDGSTDNTRTIIRNIIDERIQLIESKNIGCINSFSELVYIASRMANKYDYFAFADQDDIWNPYKLWNASIALDKLTNHDQPNMYACNMNIVDENNRFVTNLRPIVPLRVRKGQLLLGGHFAGCVTMFNKSALKMYTKFPPKSITYHDYWMSLICVFLGIVIYDKEPYINYRQHSNNVLGAHYFLESKTNNLYNKLKKYFVNRKNKPLNYKAIYYFKKSFADYLSLSDLILIDSYLHHKDSIKKSFNLMFNSSYYPLNSGFGFILSLFKYWIRIITKTL